MDSERIETFAARIPFKEGIPSDASTAGNPNFAAAVSRFATDATDQSLQDLGEASGFSAAAAGGLRAGGLRQGEAPVRAPRQERPSSDRSDVRIGSFVLASIGMLCAAFLGFVSEIRPLDPNSPDRGYDEALGNRTLSVSSANFPRDRCDEGAPIFGAAMGGRERTGVRATVGCVDAWTADLNAKPRGGNHVE